MRRYFEFRYGSQRNLNNLPIILPVEEKKIGSRVCPGTGKLKRFEVVSLTMSDSWRIRPLKI
jgi:hypothetical protein